MTDHSTTQNPSRRQRFTAWLAHIREAFRAGPRVRAGVQIAMACFAALMAIIFGGALRLGFGRVADPVLGALLFLALVILFILLTAIVTRLAQTLAGVFSWRAFLLMAGTFGALIFLSPFTLLLALPTLALATILGAAIGGLAGGGFREARVGKKIVLITTGVIATVAIVGLLIILATRGSDDHLVAYQSDPIAVPTLDEPDPSEPGIYPVLTLTYGSGTDTRRPEFGTEAVLRTDTVDATAFVEDNKGWRMKLREWYWGFDFEHFPVNGRVWYPDGDGPFPLVLVVHGNHSMEEYSDPGYSWLGELLASRGFICVSVDENFFNGSWGSDLKKENDGRGWMLLEHLRVWSDWSESTNGPFAGKVDIDRIALIGHSRGGEAAAIAGAFNRLARYPDDATVEFDSGFSIRAIVAIAPSDGQYEPADRPTPLENVSYLAIQGGHDSDVAMFMGARQYRRTRFSDDSDHFKASVWAYRANHGQFNTVWGDDDWGWPDGVIVNRKPLLSGEEQRRFGGVVISAFLEATLNGRDGYRTVFRDLRTAREWLPEDFYITRFQDNDFLMVADFEEDVDVTTATLGGAHFDTIGLEVWREEHQSFRKWGSKRNGVAVVGWRIPENANEGNAEGDPETVSAASSYTLSLPTGAEADLGLGADSVLVFSIADTGETPPEEDEDDRDEEEGDDQSEDADSGDDDEEEEPPEPIDLTIEVTTVDGTSASLPLSSVRRLVPPLNSRFTKLPTEGFAYGAAWEVTLQTVEVPLALFSDRVPNFDPSTVTTVSFIFDRTPEGVVIIDDIGLTQR